ncbi:MAG TPA: dihydrofolate reductase [Azonexus sp.]
MNPNRPEIVLIAAVARNRVIGRDNRLLWNIPEDMAHFKALTAGHTVIMGRKTWESLPPRFRPLPGRRNIVVSRQAGYDAPGGEVAGSLEGALALAAGTETAFVIGGEQIYAQALPLARRLEITEVDLSPEGDAWFPEIPAAEWQESARREAPRSEGPGCAFVTYRRR